MATRADSFGLFWHDVKKEKAPPKEKIKRTPPPAFWLEPGYLPGLQEALRFDVPLFTDQELWQAAADGERLVFDIESYPNYFLIAFKSLASGKVVYFEDSDTESVHTEKLAWVMQNFCIIGFNSENYDVPIATLAINQFGCEDLWAATEDLIVRGERPGDVLRKNRVRRSQFNHIDLIEVAPLRASLKIYAGRCHLKRMQDLPFQPGTILSPEQIAIVRHYCVNDLAATEILYSKLEEHVILREDMSKEYNTDLRSKSDAQIAEAVISSQLAKVSGKRVSRPKIEPGAIKYNIPDYLKYQSPEMQWVLEVVRKTEFVIDETGTVSMPESLSKMNIPLGHSVYTMGIGGLHSNEKKATHYADEETVLLDRDVTSYYPFIILNQGLFPKHLGKAFLAVYRSIVERRVAAKAKLSEIEAEWGKGGKNGSAAIRKQARDLAVVSDSLKITINGSFGKLGSPYSVLYSPNLLIQVTLTGQLSLLMLVERFELAGIPVVSGNTDGVVIKCPVSREADLNAIVAQWEKDTGFNTEETRYRALYSRDVNNYIAVGIKGDVKVKGTYAERGSSGNSVLSKNPVNLIVSDSVIKFLTDGTPLVKTIKGCKNIERFVTVRNVTGGAVKIWEDVANHTNEDADESTPKPETSVKQEFLGKSVRWYYARNIPGEIVYAKNGNKVPKSDGAKPLMELPDTLPSDIDYDWYIDEAERMLADIGAV